MADTIHVYLENEKCDDCGNSPVTFQHWGSLTNYEMKKICKDCMKKRAEKETLNDMAARV
jgi:hypothetical protein